VALFVLPAGAACARIQQLYRSSARELGRLTAVSRSPIYHNFNQVRSNFNQVRST
jgi:hypothetical protein